MANYLVLSCRIKLYSPHKRESICTVVWRWRLKDYLDLFCFTPTLPAGRDLLPWNFKSFKCGLLLYETSIVKFYPHSLGHNSNWFNIDTTRCTKYISVDLSCKFIVMWLPSFVIIVSISMVFYIAPCVFTTMFEILWSRSNMIYGLNVEWSFLQTEVKASDWYFRSSSWQKSAFKNLKNIMLMLRCANDMWLCNLWLNRFGSWDKVVKFDANNLYLQNNKRQT